MKITRVTPLYLFIFYIVSVGFGSAQVTLGEKKQIEAAQAILQEGNFQEALIRIDAVIRKNPRIAATYKLRGDCRLFQGDYANAILDYNSVVNLAGKQKGLEETYNNRGLANFMLRNYENALSDYKESVRLRPTYAYAYNGLGVTFEKLGKTDEAFASFESAIKIDSLFFAAYEGRGGIYFRRNQLVLALSDYNFYLKKDPDAAGALIVRGAVNGLLNKWELSVYDLRSGFESFRLKKRPMGGILSVSFADVETYIKSFPNNAKAYAVRGFINYLRSEDIQAEQDFTKCFSLDPSLRTELSELIASVKERR